MGKVKNATSIGGQALIEGVMMKGPKLIGIAVRRPDGEIETKTEQISTIKDKYPILKLPFVRGIVNFIEMMQVGYKTLMYSAQVSGEEEMNEEPTKFEKWLSKTLGKDIFDIMIFVALVLGIGLSVGLFIVLPTFLTGLLGGLLPSGGKTVIEGVTKFALFIGYILLVSRMKEIRRVFEYHGAEHKSIFAYEAGKELTVENVRSYGRLHPRCGTSFIAFVLLISILVFSFVSWDNVLIRIALKLLSLPFIVGISYEIIKLAGAYDNIITRVLSVPGKLLQKLTTAEPDDKQIEVALAALKLVLPEKREEAKW